MPKLVPDPDLWRTLFEDASHRFTVGLWMLNGHQYYRDWSDTMMVEPVASRVEEPWIWTDPPAIDHYSFLSRDEFIERRLNRALDLFVDLGITDFAAEYSVHLDRWESCLAGLEAKSAIAAGPWAMKRADGKRATAGEAADFRAFHLTMRSGIDLDAEIHSAHDAVIQTAVSESIVELHRKKGVVPEPNTLPREKSETEGEELVRLLRATRADGSWQKREEDKRKMVLGSVAAVAAKWGKENGYSHLKRTTIDRWMTEGKLAVILPRYSVDLKDVGKLATELDKLGPKYPPLEPRNAV